MNMIHTSATGVSTAISVVPGAIASTMSTAACLAVSTTPTTAAVTAPTAPATPPALPSAPLSVCTVCVLVCFTGSGVATEAGLNGDSGRAGARYTLFKLPSLSISVGRSSVVAHLPSTMYLYATFSPQGIWMVPSKKPERDLVR